MISLLDLKRQCLALRGVRKGDAAANAGMNEAAMLQAQTGRDALTWFQQEYARTEPDRAAATSRAQELSGEQLQSMRLQNQIAADTDRYNRETFRPLEQRMVGDAQAFDTPERREAAAAEAGADVRMATGRQQDALSRSLMRSGVNPGSGAALAARQQGALAAASAEAGAETMARRRIEDGGWARMADAASLGRNLPGQQVAQAQTGIAAGQASQQSSNARLSAATSGADLLGQGFTSAMQGYRGSGQLYGQMASNAAQSSAGDAALMGSLGTLAGAVLFASDEEVKSGTDKPADTKEMLSQVDAIKVKQGWRYDPAKGGPDDGGMRHDGPMAGNVQQVMGDEVAPGGQAIDPVSMNGRLIGAVQEVSKRLKRIERMVAA